MRILIADDHELLRDMFVLYLGRGGDVNVRTASSYDTALARVRDPATAPFDLVLLDVYMPGMNGLRGLSSMLRMCDARRVAMMSGQATRSLAAQALAMGAAGFLSKTLSADAFEGAVRRILGGETVSSTDALCCAATESCVVAKSPALSPRETQVLAHLCQGTTNKEIALALDIREPTVKLHVKSVYRKLGASNRTHAAAIARDRGLF